MMDRIEELVKKMGRLEGQITKHSKRDSEELELTEAKMRKIGGLQVKVAELQKKIDLAVDNLKSALKQLESDEKRKARGVDDMLNNDSEDDEFYDRTKGNKIKQQIKELNK